MSVIIWWIIIKYLELLWHGKIKVKWLKVCVDKRRIIMNNWDLSKELWCRNNSPRSLFSSLVIDMNCNCNQIVPIFEGGAPFPEYKLVNVNFYIHMKRKLQMKHSFILKWRLCFYNVLVTKVVSLKMSLYFVVILNNTIFFPIFINLAVLYFCFLIETCDIRIHKYTFTDHFVRLTCLLMQSNNLTWQHDQDNLLKFSIKKGKEGDSSQFECDCSHLQPERLAARPLQAPPLANEATC